jgi:hypothetical protein
LGTQGQLSFLQTWGRADPGGAHSTQHALMHVHMHACKCRNAPRSGFISLHLKVVQWKSHSTRVYLTWAHVKYMQRAQAVCVCEREHDHVWVGVARRCTATTYGWTRRVQYGAGNMPSFVLPGSRRTTIPTDAVRRSPHAPAPPPPPPNSSPQIPNQALPLQCTHLSGTRSPSRSRSAWESTAVAAEALRATHAAAHRPGPPCPRCDDCSGADTPSRARPSASLMRSSGGWRDGGARGGGDGAHVCSPRTREWGASTTELEQQKLSVSSKSVWWMRPHHPQPALPKAHYPSPAVPIRVCIRCFPRTEVSCYLPPGNARGI